MSKPIAQKDVDTILALPLARKQMALAMATMKRECSEALRDEVVNALQASLPADQLAAFAKEKQHIEQALKTGLSPAEPDISTPALQLLWGAYLAHEHSRQPKPIAQTGWWKQLQTCDSAERELRKHALYIARDRINTNTKLEWGAPGSMFYSDPVNNSINIDFLMSLIAGFDNTRSIVFHEIGHSKVTRGYTPRMNELYETVQSLQEKQKVIPLSAEEYGELHASYTEWQMRNALFQEAENCTVNRYAILAGERIEQPQDDVLPLSAALNHVEVVIAQAGEHPLPQEDTPNARFENLARAVRMSLYQNNELFENTPQDWQKIGVNPGWITAWPEEGKPPLPPAESLERLRALCGDKKRGLEYMQPGALDQMKGTMWLDAATTDYAEKRNALMEQIWDEYAEPLLRQHLEALRNQMQEMAEEKQQQQGPSLNVQVPPQSGDQGDAIGDGQAQGENGEAGEGQAQGDDPSDGQGKGKGTGGSSGGQSGQGQSGESGESESDPSQSDQSPSDQSQGEQSSDGAEQDSKTQDGEGKEGEGQEGEGQGQGQGQPSPDAKGKGAGEASDNPEDMVDVEGAGQLPGVKPLPKSPEQAQAEAGKKANEAQGKQSGDSKSLQELLDEMQKAKEKKQGGKGEGQGEGEEAESEMDGEGGEGAGQGAGNSNSDDDIKLGDWRDYQKAVSECMPQIMQARRLLIQIQEKQSQTVHHASHNRSLEPTDGNMERFDMRAHQRLVEKIVTGRPTVEDMKRFVVDKETKIPASIDIVIHTDCSGSMQMGGGSRGYSPLQAAMNMVCILNEAARKPRNLRNKRQSEGDIRVWGSAWGDARPKLFIKPDDNAQTVGEAIAGVMNGAAWGTSFAPSVKMVTDEIAEYRGSQATALTGFTHHLVFSDGDIADRDRAVAHMDALLQNDRNCTMDFVIISPHAEQGSMAEMARAMQKKHGESRIKIVPCAQPQDSHNAVLALLRQRMMATAQSEAIAFSEKQKGLQRASGAMR